MKANKPGFGNTDLQTTIIDHYPEIEDKIVQTLSRLMGFDNANQLYRQLLADADGRLLVSSSPTQATIAVNSAAVVGIVSSQILAANNSRRSAYIQNLGGVPIYIAYGIPAAIATGLQIPVGGIFIEDRYLGAINAISTVAAQDVRIVEI